MPKPPVDSKLPATLGRYEVAQVIGAGAMGRVLLAHDPVLGRDVAIKLLRDDLRVAEDVRQGLIVRMQHEARAAARVAHPNLVTLHDMGEDPEVGLYLVFEYVEGPTLKQRLVNGPLSPRQAARLARELGAALTFAHNAGILHRDVKPENVILSATGGKIADFGIARIPNSTLTYAGGLLGTPAYSAPETFRSGQFSPESDQFSLAATLYEAVSGERAFPGDDAVAVAARIALGAPDRVSEALGLAVSVDDALARAMSLEPADRFASCEVFGRALAGALSLGAPPESDDARSPTPIGSSPIAASPPAPPRKSGQVMIGAVVVVVTAGLLVRAALQSEENETLDALDSAAALGSEPSAAPPAPKAPRVTPRPPKTAEVPFDPTPLGVSSEPDAGPSSSESDAGATPAPETDAGADAGKPIDAGATSDAGAPKAPKPAGDAGAAAAPAPTPSATAGP